MARWRGRRRDEMSDGEWLIVWCVIVVSVIAAACFSTALVLMAIK